MTAQSQWSAGIGETLRLAQRLPNLALPFGQSLEVYLGATSLWLRYRFAGGAGLALRTCFDPQGLQLEQRTPTDSAFDYQLTGGLGRYRVRVELPADGQPVLRYTTWLQPAQAVRLASLPPDLYALNEHGAADDTEATVHAVQSGPATGLAYVSFARVGSVLYVQNLTSLNAYCQATQTDPTGRVTVAWPQFGWSPPPAQEPLPAGQEVILSDAYLWLGETVPADELDAADQFLDAFATIYRLLPKPPTRLFDWPESADQTLRALTDVPACYRDLRGHRYLNAYVGSTDKPPESMVQLSVLNPLLDYLAWRGTETDHDLAEQLCRNIGTFFDEPLQTLVRWLPGEPFTKQSPTDEEDAAKVDSWYQLYILMGLAKLGKRNRPDANDLFFRSIDYAIRAAHHFDYEWPVLYRADTFEVLKQRPNGQGETDVAGLYVHVMLQAHALSGDDRYRHEAEAAARRLGGKGFGLLYQSHVTMIGAVALVRLGHLTGNEHYERLSRLCIANVVARLWVWQCDYGHARAYETFMGLMPLADGEYLAAYEEAETFAAALSYLRETDGQAPEPVRLLLAEYMKYVLHRGRHYHPAELPDEAIASQPREGHIDRRLPIPLEDVPTGWQQAGQVGQEVYGSACTFIKTTHAYLRDPQAPFTVFCEYPTLRPVYQPQPDGGVWTVPLAGSADGRCRLCILADRSPLPAVQVRLGPPGTYPAEVPVAQGEDYQEFDVPGAAIVRIEWQPKSVST